MTDKPVTVTKADEKAAMELLGYKNLEDALDYRNTGAQDRQFIETTKAFARHRTTHAPSQPSAGNVDTVLGQYGLEVYTACHGPIVGNTFVDLTAIPAPSQPTAGDYLSSIASLLREKGCVRMELQLDEMGGYECRFHTADSLAAMPSQHSDLADRIEEIKSRFEYASSRYHNVEYWHGEEAPDGSDLYDWFMQSFDTTALHQSPQDTVRRYAVIEECAKVCEDCADHDDEQWAYENAAAAIRALATRDAK